MTLLLNQDASPFDDSDELEKEDRAQPIAIEQRNAFIVLWQQDGSGDCTHCILLERRDIPAFINMLQGEMQ